MFLTDILDWFLGLLDRGCGTLLVAFVVLSLLAVALQGIATGVAFVITGGRVTDNLEAVTAPSDNSEEFARKMDGLWSDDHGNEVRLTFIGREPASSGGSPLLVKVETTRGRVPSLVRSGLIVGVTASSGAGSSLKAEASGIEADRSAVTTGCPTRWNGAEMSLEGARLTLVARGGVAFSDRVLFDPVTVTLTRNRQP